MAISSFHTYTHPRPHTSTASSSTFYDIADQAIARQLDRMTGKYLMYRRLLSVEVQCIIRNALFYSGHDIFCLIIIIIIIIIIIKINKNKQQNS